MEGCLQIIYIQINPSQKAQMDQDFFGSGTDPSPSQYMQQRSGEEDEFDFGANTVSIEGQGSNNNFQPSSNPNIGLTDLEINEAANRMREEEDRIMERLREKSNKEYQDKQARRQLGRAQLDDFLRQKEEETVERRKQNGHKEEKMRELNKKLSEQAGWRKVGANVGLKQGQNKSQRDTNRMREAIINKRNDQSN